MIQNISRVLFVVVSYIQLLTLGALVHSERKKNDIKPEKMRDEIPHYSCLNERELCSRLLR